MKCKSKSQLKKAEAPLSLCPCSLLLSRPSSMETLRKSACSSTSPRTSMLWWALLFIASPYLILTHQFLPRCSRGPDVDKKKSNSQVSGSTRSSVLHVEIEECKASLCHVFVCIISQWNILSSGVCLSLVRTVSLFILWFVIWLLYYGLLYVAEKWWSVSLEFHGLYLKLGHSLTADLVHARVPFVDLFSFVYQSLDHANILLHIEMVSSTLRSL